MFRFAKRFGNCFFFLFFYFFFFFFFFFGDRKLESVFSGVDNELFSVAPTEENFLVNFLKSFLFTNKQNQNMFILRKHILIFPDMEAVQPPQSRRRVEKSFCGAHKRNYLVNFLKSDLCLQINKT
jgi:hypothetical protein